MFGILFFIFMGICGIIAACRMAWTDMQVYKYQKENPPDHFEDYWMDASGHYISKKTGRICSVGKGILSDAANHECIVDVKTHNIIRDFTEEKNNRIRTLVMESDDPTITVYKWVPPYSIAGTKINGNRYVDKSTGDIYVVREFRLPMEGYKKSGNSVFSCTFYMSISNGHLIRLTDRFLQQYRLCDDDMSLVNKYISDFNLKQDKDICNKGKAGFESHFYFNSNESVDIKNEKIYNEESISQNESNWSH